MKNFLKKIKHITFPAVYTIEAALLIPIIFMIMVVSIQISISLYQEVREDAVVENEIKNFNEMEKIHIMRGAGTFWQHLTEDKD